MSGLLAGKVWQSDLASHLKPLAAALADIANDDGTSIYPSVAYMAWLLGKERRSVQVGLSQLKVLGIIEAIGSEKGGRGKPTEYHLLEANLPKRPSWKELRKGAENAPFTETKGASDDTKGRILRHERVHSSAPDPSLTVKEPNTDPTVPFVSVEFSAALAEFEQHRKEIRHKLTPTARKRLYAQLERFGEAKAVRALNLSVEKGWQGVFDPDERNGNGAAGYKPGMVVV